ncbi:MAG: DUF2249 domain-containing protein [Cyclobacteriaceae bacterium]
MTTYETIDVREIPIAERHQQITSRVLRLSAMEGLNLIVDHDPRPLYYLLKEEHKIEIEWKYLKNGPVIWEVVLTRKSGT